MQVPAAAGAVHVKEAVPPTRSTALATLVPPQPSVSRTVAPESIGIESKVTVAPRTDCGGTAGRQLASAALRKIVHERPAPERAIDWMYGTGTKSMDTGTDADATDTGIVRRATSARPFDVAVAVKTHDSAVASDHVVLARLVDANTPPQFCDQLYEIVFPSGSFAVTEMFTISFTPGAIFDEVIEVIIGP